MHQQVPLRQQQIQPRLLRSSMLYSSQIRRQQGSSSPLSSRPVMSAVLHSSQHQRHKSLQRTLMWRLARAKTQ